MSYFFTSESVSEGHPDKICDQISDAVLDAALEQDPNARVACECFATTGMVLIGGEISTSANLNIGEIARSVIHDIGYTDPSLGFDYQTCTVINVVNRQSPDIALGVDRGGAGDQGMMFGYACRETEELMPAAIMFAHKIMQRLAAIRKSDNPVLPYLRPDAKAQVTLQYSDDGTIERVDTVVVSTQHAPEVSQEQIQNDVIEHVIRAVIPESSLDEQTRYFINPTGKFVIGGPQGDTGLTGRKIIVDTYGGKAPHGGGAFSGKDPTKVDRSAAYAARHLAKNIVAAGLATECLIQIAYAIGVAEPVSIFVDTYGTGAIPDKDIAAFIQANIDLTPRGIIERLHLRQPLYRSTAVYGHFGKPDLPWEQLDLVDLFRSLL